MLRKIKIKGFTLVELLAVIVVLAIILIIAVPRVMNTIEESRKESFRIAGEKLLDAAKNKSVSEAIESVTDKTYTITNGAFVGDSFSVSGKLPANGTVIVNQDGTSAIIASSDGYCIRKYENEDNVTVSKDPICYFVTSLTLNESTIYSAEGGINQQITATVLPANALNKNVTWTSSNETVATVTDLGLVSTLTIGEATITATTVDGNFTQSCVITVVQAETINTSTGIGYTSFSSALSGAVSGETIAVQKNIDFPNSIFGYFLISKTITIDLNGKVMNFTRNGYPGFRINAAGIVTFIDGSDEQTGEIKQTAGYPTILNFGKVIINGGNFGVNNSYAIFMLLTSETTINGGIFNGGLYTNGTDSGPILTINGGTFYRTFYLAAANTTTTINNGTFTPLNALSAIEIKAGTLTINGGTFTNNFDTNSNATAIASNNGSGNFAGVIVAVKPSGSNETTSYYSPVVVNLNGGAFTNSNVTHNDSIVLADQSLVSNTYGITVNIASGVTITGNVDKYDNVNKTSVLNDNR